MNEEKYNNITPSEWFKEFMQALDEERLLRKQASEESQKEWKEIRKGLKELRKNIGGISDSNGYIVEDAIYTSVKKEMIFADVEFDYVYRNLSKHKKNIDKKGEYDIVLVNCELLTILEAKHKVKIDDIEKLATIKLDNFRLLFPEYSNHKIILGIGGMGFENNAFEKANELGIVPIRVLGKNIEYNTDSMKIF